MIYIYTKCQEYQTRNIIILEKAQTFETELAQLIRSRLVTFKSIDSHEKWKGSFANTYKPLTEIPCHQPKQAISPVIRFHVCYWLRARDFSCEAARHAGRWPFLLTDHYRDCRPLFNRRQLSQLKINLIAHQNMSQKMIQSD